MNARRRGAEYPAGRPRLVPSNPDVRHRRLRRPRSGASHHPRGLRRLEYRSYDSAGVALLTGELSVLKRAGGLGRLELDLEEDGGMPASSIGISHAVGDARGAKRRQRPSSRRLRGAGSRSSATASSRITARSGSASKGRAYLRLGHRHRGHRAPRRGQARGCRGRAGAPRLRRSRGRRRARGRVRDRGASLDDPDVIVGCKVSSPLVVGLGDGETLLASDIPAVLSRTRTVIPVEEGWIVGSKRRSGVQRFRGTPVPRRSRSTGTSPARRRAGSTIPC